MVKKEEPINLEEQTNNNYNSMCKLLGEHINFVREGKQLSLRDVYRDTNISISVLSDLEKGLKLPRFETLIKLVLYLGIPLSAIFGDKIVTNTETFSGSELENYKTFQKNPNELIKVMLLSAGYNKDEAKDIINFAEFIKSKRVKK